MKHKSTFNQSNTQSRRWVFNAAFLILALILVGVSTSLSFAQSGDQPDFSSASFASSDGKSVIEVKEALLDAAYFSSQGTLDGLMAGEAGLTLAEGKTSGIYTGTYTGIYTSKAINVPSGTTDIVPIWLVDAPEGTSVKIETRLSFDNGPYSDWLENPEAFYPVRNDAHAGNMIWVEAKQAEIQVRLTLEADQAGSSPSFQSLVLVFSNTSDGPTDAAVASSMSRASSYDPNICPVPRPHIVARSTWGCPDGQGSRNAPHYQPVTHIIVHHTATTNRPYYDYASVVRSIWHYHTITLGWGDIGYNYLIDPNGVIYEGRAGGDNAIGVRGIHRGPNAGAMAVGFIGCYGNCNYLGLSNIQPSQAMFNAGVDLMAWALGYYKIDPNSTASIGGYANIPVITGGRDVSNTLSPGDNLYSLLPAFRSQVAERLDCPQACKMSDIIFDKTEYQQNDPINLTVNLTDQKNTPVDGATIRVDVDRPAQVSAANVVDLDDQVGEYKGRYTNTSIPGTYRFRLSASDPSGNRFTPCYGEASVIVQSVATPTPAPSTPTPTPLPPEVLVEPQNLQLKLTDFGKPDLSSVIAVKNRPTLRDVELEIDYDPGIVQVDDADADTLGVQIRPNDAFLESPSLIADNRVDTVVGKIYFKAQLLGSEPVADDATLITIDWQPQCQGSTSVTISKAILTDVNGQTFNFDLYNGQVTVTGGCLVLSGAVTLQGQANHGGIIVTAASGEQTETQADGSFTIAGQQPLNFSYPGYLSAKAEPGTAQPSTSSVDGPVNAATVGQIALLAGDMNQDKIVDIFDLAYLASNLDTGDTLSDLNRDGVVNILDLAMVANNYRQQGPLTVWQ